VNATRRPGLRAGYVSQLELRLVDLEKRVRDLERRDDGQEHGHLDPHASSHSRLPPQLQGETDPPPNVPDPQDTPMFTGGDEESGPYQHQQQATPSATPEVGNDAMSPELDPLSSLVINELCGVWFDTYHPWFPILHQPSLFEALQHSRDNLETSSHWLIIKAIVAVTLCHSQSFSGGFADRREWSENLRERVVIEAMSGVYTLQSIQALLILSNLDYGSGKSHKFWYLIALCKR
jgi:hypothetical protein